MLVLLKLPDFSESLFERKTMPNWCNNDLLIVGDSDEIDSFIDGIRANPQDNHEYSILETYAPIPGGWEYNKAIEYWGCKWSDSLNNLPEDGGFEEEEINYIQTPWGPPVEGMQVVSRKFPNLKFAITWMEPGMAFYGWAIIQNGEIISNDYGDIPDFSDGLDMDDETSYELLSQREFEFQDSLMASCRKRIKEMKLRGL
jgi:hypothetical protein